MNFWERAVKRYRKWVEKTGSHHFEFFSSEIILDNRKLNYKIIEILIWFGSIFQSLFLQKNMTTATQKWPIFRKLYLLGLFSAPPHSAMNLLSHLFVAPITRLKAFAKSSGLVTCRFFVEKLTVISVFKIQFPLSSLKMINFSKFLKINK